MWNIVVCGLTIVGYVSWYYIGLYIGLHKRNSKLAEFCRVCGHVINDLDHGITRAQATENKAN